MTEMNSANHQEEHATSPAGNGASGDDLKDKKSKKDNASGEGLPDTEQLEKRLLEAEEAAEKYKDLYLRAMADMENLRRRMEKEKSDIHKFGNEKLLHDLLPVLDSFATAYTEGEHEVEIHAPEQQIKQYLDGVKLVKHQLEDAISKHGLVPILAEGERFDPNVHQAIQRIDSEDVESETVGQVYQKGYMLNGRLLRPAMVSVLVPSIKSI